VAISGATIPPAVIAATVAEPSAMLIFSLLIILSVNYLQWLTPGKPTVTTRLN
jgi:hypothetical protein